MINADRRSVKVIHGANDDTFALHGYKIAVVRASLIDAFNLPDDVIAFVDGEQVADHYCLQHNDILEFVCPWGRKEGSSFFRYPGGKFKLRNHIIETIKPYISRNIQYREPFFGGGGIGLQLLREFPNSLSSVWINDRDAGIASLWTSVIRYPDNLKQLVMSFQPTPKAFISFKEELLGVDSCPDDWKELVRIGFQKLALHQMSFSGLGVMAGGPMSEIHSRWLPGYICKKIDSIHRAFTSVAIRGNICSCSDFEKVIKGDNSFLYLDPPYYDQGEGLYKHAFAVDDHTRLARLLRIRRGPWLLSYDDCQEVRSLYEWALVEVVPVTYSITGTRQRGELLIRPKGTKLT